MIGWSFGVQNWCIFGWKSVLFCLVAEFRCCAEVAYGICMACHDRLETVFPLKRRSSHTVSDVCLPPPLPALLAVPSRLALSLFFCFGYQWGDITLTNGCRLAAVPEEKKPAAAAAARNKHAGSPIQ